jgi:hypothetical protein
MSRKCAAHEYVPPIFPAQFLRLAPRATRQGCTIRVVATCRSSELPARFARGRLPPSPYHGSRPRPGGRGPSTGAPGPADELPAVRRAQLAVRGGSVPAGSAGRKVGADHIEVQAMSEDGGAAEGGRVSVRDPRVSSEPTPGRVRRMSGAFRARRLNQGGSRRTRERCISREPGNDRHAGFEGDADTAARRPSHWLCR